MADTGSRRSYRIDGFRQEFCHILRGGRLVDGWACDCPRFARVLDCDHARKAADLYAIESDAERSGGSSARQ